MFEILLYKGFETHSANKGEHLQALPPQALDFLPFQGKVNLKDPNHIFCLLEDYGLDPNDIPDEPFYMYFGRFVSEQFWF